MAHTSAGLAALAAELVALSPADPGRVAVAIEVPRGPVVDTLLERGVHVFALNPKQLDRFRDRHTVAGAKDDRRDGFVLADALRTDQPAFRRVHRDDPALVELRELSRLDDDLREELSRLSNRLREQLHRFGPDLLALCPAADEPWFWALLDQALAPPRRKRVSLKAVTAVLKVHRIRRLTAETVQAALQVPFLRVAPGDGRGGLRAHRPAAAPPAPGPRPAHPHGGAADRGALDRLGPGRGRRTAP